MKNEPVAWMDDLSFFTEQPDDMDGVTPLYTHPEKKLTDEEILETVKDYFIGAIKLGIVLTKENVLDFARAILLKAQEK